MFVCSGNICRSPAAHAICQRMIDMAGLTGRVELESSGTGSWHVGQQADERMRAAAAQAGYTIDHLARRLTLHDLRSYDLILAMDQENHEDILAMTKDPELQARVKYFRYYDPCTEGGRDLDVPDPYYGGSEGFRTVVAMVERTCKALLDDISTRL